MNRPMTLTLTLTFNQDGYISLEEIEANINRLMQHGVSEGVITPDDEDHATLVAWDVTPA